MRCGGPVLANVESRSRDDAVYAHNADDIDGKPEIDGANCAVRGLASVPPPVASNASVADVALRASIRSLENDGDAELQT
jgi:hypothetical protein